MNTQQNNLSLLNIWTAFKRGFKRLWWLLILLALLCGSIMGIYAWKSYVPSYTASVTFTVRVNNSAFSDISAYNSKTADQLARTFPYILTSGVLSDIVKEDLKADYLPAITANAIEDANLLELKVSGTDPKFCHRVLQSVITNYPAIAERVVGPTELTIVDATGIPDTPDNQRSWKGSAEKGALVGAVLAALLMLAYGMLKATIMGRDDFQRISNANYMGSLPVVLQKKRTNPNAQVISLKTVNNRNYRDAFRTVSSRVNKALKKNDYHTLVVCSAIPGEGKTTVSFNLASSLADLRQKVLLVDCDLRNPSLYRMLKQKECAGVTEWFYGEAQLSEFIHSVADCKLDVLFAGQPTDDSVEILGSEKFKQMLASLREKYDVIILDTPPCSMLADAAELSTQADCFLMVVKQDYASRDSVISGINALQEGGMPIIGYVMNEYEGGATGRYGYGNYAYGKYGYGRQQDTLENADNSAEKSMAANAVAESKTIVTAPEEKQEVIAVQGLEGIPEEAHEKQPENSIVKADEKPKKLVDLSERKPLNTKKKQKTEKEKMSKGTKRLVIAAGVLGGIAILLVSTVIILTAVGRNAMTDDGSNIDASTLGATSEDGGMIRYKGKLYKYNKDISSVLLIGVDDLDKETAIHDANENGSQSDVNILAVLDPRSKKLTLISISRDTVCEIEVLDADGNSEGTAKAQLALSYSYGDGAESSCELTTEAVSKIFYDLNIPAYGSIYMDGIVDLVNTIGGVTVTSGGKQLKLDGDRAKQYIQYREYTVEGNNERMQRQSQVIKALVYKMIYMAKSDPKSILDIYGTVKNNATTNLDASKIVYLARQVAKLNFNGEVQNVPGHSEMGKQGHAEYYIDEEAFFDLILRTFYIPVNG